MDEINKITEQYYLNIITRYCKETKTDRNSIDSTDLIGWLINQLYQREVEKLIIEN